MRYRLGAREPLLEGDKQYIAEGARIIGSVRLLDCCSIWFNSVLRGDNDWIVIGERSNVQDGCVLHTDPGLPLRVGNGVTIGHGAMLHGCQVGDNSLIGIGATVLNGARVPANCMVGAGALLTGSRQFPEGTLILGTPARVARDLSPAEIASVRASADRYVEKAALFRSHLQPQ